MVGGIIYSKLRAPDPDSDILIESATQNTGGESSPSANIRDLKDSKGIVVDIEGAVVKPGVYELPNNSRIQDLLITAGGLSAKADRNYVSKNINLAQKLTDGGKVYIPKINEQGANTNLLPLSPNTQSVVNLNTASVTDLDKLPGIGPVTAQKIISNRPYQNITELTSRKVVSSSVFEKIKDMITTY